MPRTHKYDETFARDPLSKKHIHFCIAKEVLGQTVNVISRHIVCRNLTVINVSQSLKLLFPQKMSGDP